MMNKRGMLLKNLQEELDRRTELEEEAIYLMENGEFERAKQLLKSIDDSIAEGIVEELDKLEEENKNETVESEEESVMDEEKYAIRCGGHNYITLEWDGRFIFCLDNSLIKAEEMIYRIEKRTGMNFEDIPIKGKKDDFNGLSFFNGGWKRNFWNDFPNKEEIESYMKLTNKI